MSRYLVTRSTAYREHPPGATFEARLDPAAEARALARGDIQLLEKSSTTIRPGSWQLPRGWEHLVPEQEDRQCPSASR